MGKKFKSSTKLTAKLLVVVLVLQAALFSLTAFASGPAPVTGVTFDVGKGTQTLKVGASTTLKATASSTDVTYKAVTYSLPTSGDSTFLTLDANTGDITALDAGAGKKVNVTATSVINTTKKATVLITIASKVTSVSVAKPTLSLNVNQAATDAATVKYGDTIPVSVTAGVYWTTSDSAVVTVVKLTGAIKAAGKGTATLTAISNHDPSKTTTVTVTVYNELKSIALDSTNVKGLTVRKGETGSIKPITQTPMITGATPDVTSITYSTPTLTTPIITLDPVSGLITAKNPGTAIVTVTVTPAVGLAKKLTFNVIVPNPVSGISLKNGTTTITNAIGINVNKKVSITGAVYAANGKTPSDTVITWAPDSTNTKVGVDPKGAITVASDAIVGSTATITATAHDNLNSVSKSFVVTVTRELTTFDLQQKTAKMKENATLQVVPIAKSTGGFTPTVTSITYANDPKAGSTSTASINSSGLITTPANATPGTVTFKVTAVAGDGTIKTANIAVTVGKKVTDLKAFTKPSESIKVFGTVTLKPNITPTDAGVKTVLYTSNHSDIAFVNGRTGEVTGVSVGTAIITATTYDGGFHQDVTINVTAPDAD